jgi:ankyrin repeat protein
MTMNRLRGKFASLTIAAVLMSTAGCPGGGARAKSQKEAAADAKIEAFIGEGKDLATCGPGGAPALRLAAKDGASQGAKLLLKQGVEVDAKHKGETALFVACKYASDSHAEVVEALLRAGADPNIELEPTSDWLTSPRTPFFKASKNPNPRFLSLMLEHGADKSIRGDSGTVFQEGTVLHHAALWGLHANVELLLKAGLDKEAKDADGRTPLEVVQGTGEKFRTFSKGSVKNWSPASGSAVDYPKTIELLGG